MKTKLPNCKRKDKLFVFDLDHTLIKGNCSFLFGLYLFQENVLPFARMLRLAMLYLMHKVGFLTVRNLHEATFYHFFCGFSASTIDKYVERFLAKKFEKLIYQPAFSKLEQAKNEGYYTAILSSAPDFLVGKVAVLLGVDTWDSTIYQKNKLNHFSHITQFMEGEHKAQSVKHLMEALNLSKENVTAYTDSYLDLPFLEASGHPVAVNPDRRLKALCRKYAWPTI